MENKPLIIFDTDMDTDCDDAGALLMLINAHLRGDASLLGVIADSNSEYAAPYCKTLLDYYNLDIPVGEIYGHSEHIKSLSDYLKHQKNCEGVAYNKMLSVKQEGIISSTELYTSLLENAPDYSITIVSVGILTAMHEAMKCATDLFERKVNKIVIMGNPYKQNDFNFCMDAVSTRVFFEICPCPVYVTYLGSDITTGNLLDKNLPPLHPVRRAYEIWTGGKGRSSWDLIATLFALNPNLDIFDVSEGLRISYNDKEKTASLTKDGARDKIITLNCTSKEMESLLNGLLI